MRDPGIRYFITVASVFLVGLGGLACYDGISTKAYEASFDESRDLIGFELSRTTLTLSASQALGRLVFTIPNDSKWNMLAHLYDGLKIIVIPVISEEPNTPPDLTCLVTVNNHVIATSTDPGTAILPFQTQFPGRAQTGGSVFAAIPGDNITVDVRITVGATSSVAYNQLVVVAMPCVMKREYERQVNAVYFMSLRSTPELVIGGVIVAIGVIGFTVGLIRTSRARRVT